MRALTVTAMVMTAATSAYAGGTTITPGSGSITDAAGNEWTIQPNGSIKEGSTWVAGGGGTSALTIVNGTIYGEDSSGKGWFTFGQGTQMWTSATPPAASDGSAGNSPASARSPVLVRTSDPISPAAPTTPTATFAPCQGTKAFGILPTAVGGVGQIFGPDGTPYVGRGIDIGEDQLADAASRLLTLFPGTNFIRAPIYSPGFSDDPASYADAVQKLTSQGIVIEFENHLASNGSNAGGGVGTIYTGSMLAAEQAMYQRFAAYYKNNPYVWFGTNNEPPDPSPALSAWQLQTYKTIRATGNMAPIMLSANCWVEGNQPVCNKGFDQSAYSQMSNVIWDVHYYGWIVNFSHDQSTVDNFLARMVSDTQKFTSAGGVIMPVIIGEYGYMATPAGVTDDGQQVITAVQHATSNGIIAGSASWFWSSGGNGTVGDGDALLKGSGLSEYGGMVASSISRMSASSIAVNSSCKAASTPAATQIAQSTTASAVLTPSALEQTQPSQPPSQMDLLAQQAAAVDVQITQAQQSVDAAMKQADALLASPVTPSVQPVGVANGN